MPTPTDAADIDRQWWKEATVYQIYPRSFRDSDGDGTGDLPGILQKVDYLDDLGIDVVWLCPVYDSPNADNGYDIGDYRAIMSEFGTMEDWERLLKALHDRDIRLIMDLVVNHTSDEHAWFQKSRRREDGYEDFYYWREGTRNEPPNNWTSFMGGSAWSWDDLREQWYLHIFDQKQPDLNWRNPEVRREIKEMMTWWLDKGIDGFRMDAVNFISKREGLPDGDPDRPLVGMEHYAHGPRIHDYLRELYDETLAHYDAMTVAEMGFTTVDQAASYLGDDGDGLNMIFHFEHMEVDEGPGGRWDPRGWRDWSLVDLKEVVQRWDAGLDGRGWNSLYLGNHDQPRIVSRFGDDGEFREKSAKLLATFLLTMRGTPFIYQGDEIGMTNAEFTSVDEFDDPMTTGAIRDMLAAGVIDEPEEMLEFLNYRSRDHARTPVQWTDGPNAGFTDGTPWMKLVDNYTDINVEAARADKTSVWHHYRRLIELRGREDALVYGDFALLHPDDEQLFSYKRTLADRELLVVLNWSSSPASIAASAMPIDEARPLVTNGNPPCAGPDATYEFAPWDAFVYEM